MNNQKMKERIDRRATAGFAQTRRSFLHSAAAAGAGFAFGCGGRSGIGTFADGCRTNRQQQKNRMI